MNICEEIKQCVHIQLYASYMQLITKGRIIHAMSVVILYVEGARLLKWAQFKFVALLQPIKQEYSCLEHYFFNTDVSNMLFTVLTKCFRIQNPS